MNCELLKYLLNSFNSKKVTGWSSFNRDDPIFYCERKRAICFSHTKPSKAFVNSADLSASCPPVPTPILPFPSLPSPILPFPSLPSPLLPFPPLPYAPLPTRPHPYTPLPLPSPPHVDCERSLPFPQNRENKRTLTLRSTFLKTINL